MCGREAASQIACASCASDFPRLTWGFTSCPPKILGTDNCNYGRSCARLLVNGTDIKELVIKAG